MGVYICGIGILATVEANQQVQTDIPQSCCVRFVKVLFPDFLQQVNIVSEERFLGVETVVIGNSSLSAVIEITSRV